MSVRDRLEAWLMRWGSPSPVRPDGGGDLGWKADYDEARSIARYFRWSVEHQGRPGARGTGGPTPDVRR